MFVGKGHDLFALLSRLWEDYAIAVLVKLSVAQMADFLKGRTVRVHGSFPLFEGSAREAILSELSQEVVIDVGSINFQVFLRWIVVSCINAEIFLDKGKIVWQQLATVHVPTALDLDLVSLL